jgi:predicted dehydrogenase
VSFRSGFDVYAAQPYLATDARFIIQDLGIHILDVARFLLGGVGSHAGSFGWRGGCGQPLRCGKS